MDSTKRCAACAMELRDEATRCPHCRAVQPGAVMHRGGEGRKLLGVCLALSRHFGLDVALVRVAFVILLAVFGGTPLMVYLLLWAFTPPSAIGKAPIQRVVDWMVGPAEGSGEPKVERRV
ncbi:PspC domain-containing protein [Hyalangium gracile]|uniref:PspC domain-containing protein n=1 Tax=Hyalangium gracile TaxID=394092 RepID=UPI001CCA7D9A|nr:PspC domain-containing protein [Hyalangium gracile]